MKGLKELIIEHGLNVNNAKDVVHATTVATNTILEGKVQEQRLLQQKVLEIFLNLEELDFPNYITFNIISHHH